MVKDKSESFMYIYQYKCKFIEPGISVSKKNSKTINKYAHKIRFFKKQASFPVCPKHLHMM